MLLNSFLGHDALTDKDVNESLERLHILLRQEVIVHGNRDEVDEAAVQFQVSIDVPEWVVPVIVVQVSIASEHLLDNALDILVVVLWEA